MALEIVWVFYEKTGGFPPPPEGVTPSVALDKQCDDVIRDFGYHGPPSLPPSVEVAQWLRVRAVAAWALATARQKEKKRPHRADLNPTLNRYLITEWHRHGLREWHLLRTLTTPGDPRLGVDVEEE